MIRSNYKKIIYFLTAFVVVGNTLLAPALDMKEIDQVKAQNETELKYNPTDFHYLLSRKMDDSPEIMLRWHPPKNIDEYLDKHISYNKNDVTYRWSLTEIGTSNKYDFKSPLFNFGSDTIEGWASKHIDIRELTWGKKYKAIIEIVDYNESNKAVIGRAVIDIIDMDKSKTVFKGIEAKGTNKCPITNLEGWWEHYENFEKHNLHLRWEYGPFEGVAGKEECISSQTNPLVFEVKPNVGMPFKYQYEGGAKKGQDFYQVNSGKDQQPKEGIYTVCIKKVGGENLGCAEVNMSSYFQKGASGGEIPDNGLEKTNTTDNDDECKFNILNLGGYIRYAMCFVGHLFLKAAKWIIEFALGSLLKVSQISDIRFTPEFIPTTHAEESKTLAEAVRSQSVKNVWFFALSFVDIIIILTIIIVAFSQILNLQIDNYTVKKALPALILGIIGAHLSYFIILGLLDLSQVISVEILNKAGGKDNLSLNLAKLMGYGDTKAIGGGVLLVWIATLLLTGWGLIIAIVLLFILFFIPAIIILLLTLLMYWRIYMILILTAIAPLAFLAMGIPQATQYFKIWWKNLFNWISIGPIIMFILALAASFKDANFVSSSTSLTDGETPTDIGAFGGWVIGLILLSAAFTIPLKMLGGPVGQAIAGFAKSGARSAQKYGMGAMSNRLNKNRTNYREKMKDLNELKRLRGLTTRTPEQDAEMQKLQKKFKYGGEFRTTVGAGMSSLINLPADIKAGAKAQEDYYKNQAGNAQVTSRAFQLAAGPKAGNRAIINTAHKDNENLSEPALRSKLNREAYGKRISQAVLENKSDFQTTPELQAILSHVRNGNYKEAGNAFDALVSDPNHRSDANVINASKKASSWIVSNAMGSPDKIADTRNSGGINIDRNDALVLGADLRDILKTRRQTRRGGQNVLFELGTEDPMPYTTEGYDTVSETTGLRRAGFRQTNSNSSSSTQIMPDLDIDDTTRQQIVADLKITPTLDDTALEAMSSKIRQKVTDLRMKNGITNPVSDQEITRARTQIKQFHDEFHKQQDRALDERIGEQYDAVMEGMRAKIDTGVEFDPTSLHQQTQKALQSIDKEIQGGSIKLTGDPLSQVQEIMSKVSLSTDVSKSNIAALAQVDPKAVRAQLAKYEKVLGGLVGKTEIKSADIQLTPKAQGDIKLEMKTEDVKSELSKLQGALGDELQSTIHATASSTGPLNQDWIKPIQSSLAQAARTQGLQLGQQNMEAATRELLTAIDQHIAQGGQLSQIKTSELQESISQSLGRHSKQTVQVQGTYGEGI